MLYTLLLSSKLIIFTLLIIYLIVHERKELVAPEDAYQESEANWTELLNWLRTRSLIISLKIFTGGGIDGCAISL